MNSYEANKKVRKVWIKNPETKVKGSAKKYDRNKDKEDVQKIIEQDLEEDVLDEFAI